MKVNIHKGHQALIERAILENEQVKVMIYQAPETIKIPLKKRAGWIRQLYPSVEVIEAEDGPTEVGYTTSIMHRQEQYILAKLNGAKISKFYSSEPYGHHVSKALGALDCRIDSQRQKVARSSSTLRNHHFTVRNSGCTLKGTNL
jgi:HTH-type transcriptional repressor of NAD biosynthesis genes